jgi:hypothetical protein
MLENSKNKFRKKGSLVKKFIFFVCIILWNVLVRLVDYFFKLSVVLAKHF